MKRFLASFIICLLTLVPSPAQEKSVRPGINKGFENPDPKVFVRMFEGESREIAAHAKEIVAACKLKPGMVVADVGAGTGLFTRKFAAEVGEKGKVFAVDIAPTFLRYIEKTCQESGIKNVETILCDQFSTKLPKNSVDIMFICDTYHHFEFPQKTLASIHEALRPGGQIILIDFQRIPGKSSDSVMGHVRAGQEVFIREITTAGFKVVGEEKFLEVNYFVRFEKTTRAQGTRLRATLKGHTSYVSSVVYSPDGRTLASGSLDTTIKLWDVATGKELATLKGHTAEVNSVAYSPDGNTLASGSRDKTIKLWDMATGKAKNTLKGHEDDVTSVKYSPDGKTLASGSFDGTIKLWDVTTGKELITLKGHKGWVNSVAFSPDGKTLASGSSDKTIKLWKGATGEEQATFKGHMSSVFSVAYGPDGKTLASGSLDSTIKLWDMATGNELATLKGHTAGTSVVAVVYSPDGKMLASGSWDSTIRLWDVATGKERATIHGHTGDTGGVLAVAYNPDGKALASGSGDNTIKLWGVPAVKQTDK
jgi:WD40 repeat protein